MNYFQMIFVVPAGCLVFIVLIKTYLKYSIALCTSKARLDGKVVIVTGATSGIGLETAKNLAKRGAKVYIPCRNLKLGATVAEKIILETRNNNVFVRSLDLSSMKSVREFCDKFKEEESRLDILINNAGVALTEKVVTSEGFELHYMTNYLGPFLLTNLLLSLMVKTAEDNGTISRIVNVSSLAHKVLKEVEFDNLNSEKRYDAMFIYAKTKLYNILFNLHLDTLLKDEITTNVLHPGAVQTEIFRHAKTKLLWNLILRLGNSFFRTPREGAQTSIHLAVSESVEGLSGLYWDNCKNVSPSSLANNRDAAKQLWEISMKQTRLEDKDYYFAK